MQKIIDGKLYDTEKAELICRIKNIRYVRDYYRTNKGTFFCHYVTVGKMELINENVIKDILAEVDVNKYIDLFGDVAEG